MVSAQTPHVVLVDNVSYAEPRYAYWVVGHIRNEGASPARNVVMTFTYYDANHTVLGANDFKARPAPIPAGATAPFAFGKASHIEEIVSYRITISAEPSNAKTVGPETLKAENVGTSFPFKGEVRVTGEIHNTGAQAAADAKAYAVAYDTAGQMLDYMESGVIGKTIPPGETMPFEIDLHLRDHDFGRFEVFAQASTT